MKCDCYTIQTVDAAAEAKESADYFVVTTCVVTPTRDLLVLDVWRTKAETTEHETMLMDCYRRWMPSWVGVEDVTFGKNIFQRMTVLGYPVVALKADRDKFSRSLPVQARYAAGAVYHLQGAHWLGFTEEELLHFPLGAHDDIVDTISYAGLHLMLYPELMEKKVEEDPPDDRKKGSLAKRMGYHAPQESPDEYY